MKFQTVNPEQVVEKVNTRQSRKNTSQDVQDLLNYVSTLSEGDCVSLTRDTAVFPITFPAIPGKLGMVEYSDGEKSEEMGEGMARSRSNGRYMAAITAMIRRANDQRDTLRLQRYPNAVDCLHLVLRERSNGKTPFAPDGISRIADIAREYITLSTGESERLSAALIAHPDNDPDATFTKTTGRKFQPFTFDELSPTVEAEEETTPAPTIRPKAKK